MSPSLPVVRCAIYTRKSTEEGLEQSFNTLQAQRESAEAYILSHKQEGWRRVGHLQRWRVQWSKSRTACC